MNNLSAFAGPHPSPSYPVLRKIGPADLSDALIKGVNDFLPVVDLLANTMFAVVFSINYALLCIYLFNAGLPLLFPFMSGLALIGPFIAIGFFEVSRRRELGLQTSWSHVAELRHSPSMVSILTLGVMLLILFVSWMAAAEHLYRWLFGTWVPESLQGFLTEVLTTSRGWALIILGNAIGFVFAVVALSVSAVSFPMLLDHNVGMAVAVQTSVRTVLLSPLTMALWGVIIGVSLAIGFLFAFVGLVFVVPVLAHASWHLYRKAVQ